MNARNLRAWLALGLIGLMGQSAEAGDWTQWRGSNRDAVWTESGILREFPDDGLEFVWRKPIGSGYSAPLVAKGRIITMDYNPKPETKILEAVERIVCLDEETGETIWTDEWETHYRRQMHSYASGPRAAGIIDGDRVYGMGATGIVRCVNFDTGELIWTKDSVEDWGAGVPMWGFGVSPLIHGDLLILSTGDDEDGQIRALNKTTGELVWKQLKAEYEIGYSPPVIIEAGGTEQLILWDPKAIHSFAPETGEIYWQQPFQLKGYMAIATPQVADNKLYVSGFYNGTMAVQLSEDEPTAELMWHVVGKNEFPPGTKSLHSVVTTPVVIDGYMYSTCSYGEFRCIDLKDGSRVWTSDKLTRQGRWGSCFMVKNDDVYFLNNDMGELLIVQFSPEGPTVIDRTKLIEPTTSAGFGPRKLFDDIVNWVHPAYANGHIITRNDNEIVRASLKK